MNGLDPEKWEKNVTPKSFFNHCKKTITVTYLDDQNQSNTVIIPPLTLVTYPTYLADIFIKRVVDELAQERDVGYLSPEKRAELLKDILV